ncbi:uncharacterized protein [Salminus brasiliensis]|uniref:uncharacterized protein n=1 Tax=Salminus brasiliensis TaxID=930266 RepID=UPI003B838981
MRQLEKCSIVTARDTMRQLEKCSIVTARDTMRQLEKCSIVTARDTMRQLEKCSIVTARDTMRQLEKCSIVTARDNETTRKVQHSGSDRSGPSVRERNTPSLKFLVVALSLLLLCALVALCVVGVLYFSKGVSSESVSDQCASAVEPMSAQLHNATAAAEQLKSHLHQVQANYENALRNIASFNETERKYEELKVKSRKAHEAFSNCSDCQNCALCGDGWKPFGVKCYYFSTDKLNWMNSRDHCAEKGGHLVIITSQAEQDFLALHLHENHWIGLNDLETEGKWMWVNHQSLTETGVTFWYKRSGQPNEPDNWKNEDPSGENCAELHSSDTWFDASCHKLKKYVCVKDKLNFF